MKKTNFFKLGLLLIALTIFSCSSDDSETVIDDDTTAITDDDTEEEEEEEIDARYVIMSSEASIAGDVAYLNIYQDLPSNDIANARDGSTQVDSYGRFNTYENKWAFKKKKFTGETGIVRYSMNANGTLDLDGFISTSTLANYAILDDTNGYYYDSGDGARTINTFNPKTMARTGDFTVPDAIFGDELETYDIALGTQTMAISGDKLFINVAYDVILNDAGETPEGVYIPGYSLLVINTTTNEVEKKITHSGPVYTQGHGTRTEFPAYVIADDGDIYFSTHALGASRLPFNPEQGSPISCVFKLEFDDLDFDTDWVLTGAEIQSGSSEDNYVVWSMALDDEGVLYVNCSQDPILADYSNLLANIYYPYIIDLNSKSITTIDVPATNFGHADGNLHTVNGEVYYQLKDSESASGAYYKLTSDANGSEIFKVTDTFPRALGYLEVQE